MSQKSQNNLSMFTPQKTIGILGSGQLGRMLVIAASQLGLRTHVYAPDASNSPAGDIAHESTQANYDDRKSLALFANNIDAVTSEFENVPASTMAFLSQHCLVSPGQAALHTAQHRIREKKLAQKLGIKTPAFWHIANVADLHAAMTELNGNGILKTCQLGYDGKGQAKISSGDDLDVIFKSLQTNDAILEEMVPFCAEASFLAARSTDGTVSLFPPSLNYHNNGILARSIAPADLSDALLNSGQTAVHDLANALDVVGLLALETFVTDDNQLLFNEIAPRPHNSFHWTIEGCACSQFTQLIRAVAGMPLGSTHCYGKWQMDNLLGEDMTRLGELSNTPEVHLHLYGKTEIKIGRKMGHTNRQISLK
ncbi:5-(carboxyamino)imidazole ribonucleotide synthase [Candidatus Puniceispirillum sp.]|nr:5-(carboxyamino)imidazole ribonucleotide synthase [Candidatus Puniceispirillum sp.]